MKINWWIKRKEKMVKSNSEDWIYRDTDDAQATESSCVGYDCTNQEVTTIEKQVM